MSGPILPLVRSDTSVCRGPVELWMLRSDRPYLEGIGNGSKVPSARMGLGTPPYCESKPLRLKMSFMSCDLNRSFACGKFAVQAVSLGELGLHSQRLGQVCLDRLSGAQPLAEVGAQVAQGGDTSAQFRRYSGHTVHCLRLPVMVCTAALNAVRE